MVSGFVLGWVDLFLPYNYPQGGTCNLYQIHHSHLLFFVILPCSQIFKDPPKPENHCLCYGIQSCHTGDPVSFSRPRQPSKPYLLTVLKPIAALSSLLPAFLGDWIHILKRCNFEKSQEYLPFQTSLATY